MIEVNDVIQQGEDRYRVTEIIGNDLYCLLVTAEGKTMDQMAVLDARTAVKVTAPPPEEEDAPLDPPEEEEEA